MDIFWFVCRLSISSSLFLFSVAFDGLFDEFDGLFGKLFDESFDEFDGVLAVVFTVMS